MGMGTDWRAWKESAGYAQAVERAQLGHVAEALERAYCGWPCPGPARRVPGGGDEPGVRAGAAPGKISPGLRRRHVGDGGAFLSLSSPPPVESGSVVTPVWGAAVSPP